MGIEESENNSQVYTTQESMEESKNTMNEGIEESKSNRQVYTT